jgi:hypothetical protein
LPIFTSFAGALQEAHHRTGKEEEMGNSFITDNFKINIFFKVKGYGLFLFAGVLLTHLHFFTASDRNGCSKSLIICR